MNKNKIINIISKIFIYVFFIIICCFFLSFPFYVKTNHYEFIMSDGTVYKCCTYKESQSLYTLIPISGSIDTVWIQKDEVKKIIFKIY